MKILEKTLKILLNYELAIPPALLIPILYLQVTYISALANIRHTIQLKKTFLFSLRCLFKDAFSKYVYLY
jgi:hypothetical protein